MGKYGPALWCVVEVWDCARLSFQTAGTRLRHHPIHWLMFRSFVLDVLDLLPK